MVTEMTKYTFILLEEETGGFMQKLQELGVVDITRSRKPVDADSAAMLDAAGEKKKAMSLLDKADYHDDPDCQAIRESADAMAVDGNNVSSDEDGTLSATVIGTASRITELQERLADVKRAAKARMPWGEFDSSAIAGLEQKGLKVRFYCVPKKSYDKAWEDLQALQVINDDGRNVWFVTVSGISGEYSFPVKESPAPSGSYGEAMAEAGSIRQKLIREKAGMLRMKGSKDILQKEYEELLSGLDLYLAEASGEQAVGNRLSIFEGFAPSSLDGTLGKEFDGMGIFWIAEKAVEEDNPPIKLKNNRFASMFEVLTGMYGMPAYREYDPTPVLGPFFLLFFALCLGDAGYGLVLVALGFFLKKKMPSMAPLVMTLGTGTFFIGIFMHTFFGFDMLTMDFIPDWMKKCMLNGDVAGFPAAMVLAIGIGIFNTCVALVMKALCYTHRFGLKENLGTWGWTLLIVGGVILAGVAMLGVMKSEVVKWIFIVLAVISGLGIYIFNKPGRNPFVNIGAGLWDTYNMATGLLGDTLSFIRLYALGLAGGMLGSTFNMLGGMLMESCPVPVLNWVLFAVIFLIGHALNIALSCLGAFVHPLRLTFVEFFKNSGYEGSGKPYNPLTFKKEEA